MNKACIAISLAATLLVLAAGCRKEEISPVQKSTVNKTTTTNFGPIFVEEWVQAPTPTATLRKAAIGFAIGSKGYMGGGEGYLPKRIFSPAVTLNDFWEYDPAGNTWTQKANLLVPIERAATFVVGTQAYLCTGYAYNSSGYNLFNQLYQYDQASNTWTQKASLPAAQRCDAVGTSILNEGYIGTGSNLKNPFFSDWWQYDPPTDHWTQKANLPGQWGRAYASSFSIGQFGYITCGSVWATGPFENDLWLYIPVWDLWVQKASLPASGRAAASGFNYGSYGAVTCGVGANGDLNDFWYYDATSNSWTSEASMNGGARDEAVGFAINGIPYVGTGENANVLYTNDFWYLTYVLL